MRLREISREIFSKQICLPEDKFAKTFIAKCNMMDTWENCKGIFLKKELTAAIVVTYGKRAPRVANLQLLHTFAKHRRKGYAKILCEEAVSEAFHNKLSYFRISAEPESVSFYEKIGFRFVGRQKSGCHLSIFPLTSPIIEKNTIVMDSLVHSALYSKRKGGCVEIFESMFK